MGIFFKYLLYFISGLILSLILVPVIIKIAYKFSIVDKPDGRLKKHDRITPYLGGIPLYMAFAVVYFIEGVFSVYLLLGLSFIVILGLIDDLRALKPLHKFLGQLVSGLFLLLAVEINPSFGFSYLLFYFYKYIFILTIINAFNLVDIMDGLASVIAINAIAILLVLSYIYSLYSLSFVLIMFLGSVIGFLYYNLPRAKIYLGDLGSMFMGGLLAYSSLNISCSINNLSLGMIVALIAFAVPILEVLGLIVIRSYYSIPFYQGSPHHFAIYLKNNGWSIKFILLYISLIACSFNLSLLLFLFKIINLQGLIALLALLFIIWSLSLFGKYNLKSCLNYLKQI